MLTPQMFIPATLVTIAEPDPAESHEWLEHYLECAVCGEGFCDGDSAYVIGEFPCAYIHINCV